VLVLAAVSEVAAGVALLIIPSLVGQWLFGVDRHGADSGTHDRHRPGVACRPGTPLVGMLVYSAAVTPYLAYVGFTGGVTGIRSVDASGRIDAAYLNPRPIGHMVQ
jgi:hypothetical protein